MQAQVRTIVALTGERLVVMPEAQYTALVNASGQQQAGSTQAVSPAQMMAAMPTANTPRPAAKRAAPKAAARPVAPAATPAAPVAPETAETPSKKGSLEDVLLFG
ncbi:hypothetical protein GCM10019059_04540 [Camelimonas fluminis]|uniref:PRTRC genetic system protein E n=1 Tax=Camelimonas fluminis TaxID=1576911 RepID=A0ABV7UCW6_9HYPH|nr:hypothetical protein [Camelimonas fluminis]GHE48773.1 hypothetical protein GCM10019059_04540 [Camelimonas fluminis]